MEKNNFYWTIKDFLDNLAQIDFPEYQREPTVWNLEKKQRLIDSVIRGIDIASIYLFKKEEKSYDCIDGRQRINAIISYLGINKEDKDDNGFHVPIVNEIYEDSARYRKVNNKRFSSLPQSWKDRILNYKVSVVIIEKVENEEELNLFFLRLQLGQILNAGEKLHAMIGEMKVFIFEDVGRHDFFSETGISIPYRRYAREQVAAQITLNYFSKKRDDEFHTSRYIDLQEFFKERSRLNEEDKKLTNDIKQKLDKICYYFKDKLNIIRNRAIAVSVFLFVSDLIDQGKEKEIEEFVQFLVKFMRTLKWQIPKGVRMDEAYHYLLDFQTYVTQAAGEKYAIRNRDEFLNKSFYYYQKNNAIEGDDKYLKTTGKKAEEERNLIKF